MSEYHVIGLMSGTSLDGLDVARCIFQLQDDKWNYRIAEAKTYPYTPELKQKLANAENLSGLELLFFHNEYGRILGGYVNEFIGNNKTAVDFIASHGHTIFHQPGKGLTFQIGSGAGIAAETGITTICDFRTLDVALGGQGAPLVPVGDKLLFGDFAYCLNLGGFANISYDDESGKRQAYDVCPVNIVINHLVAERGLSYDPQGEIARNGKLNPQLLKALNDLDFYSQVGPKSLGKEWVLSELLPSLQQFDIPLEDKLRTFYEHVAFQIHRIIGKPGEILITGGGAHNLFLIELFKTSIKQKIIVPSSEIVDFKEALIFAFLGVLRFRGEVNCLSTVTGATKDNSGGIIYKV
jgi:Predicted molecular chaperone distantly related to HSP70-fold metalloproteases